jgi:glycosyltransferase involved in cell wall biosynthesis
MSLTRLSVIATHPVQYTAPLFRELAAHDALDLHVFYGWEGAAEGATHDPGFGTAFQWDVPLLDGYNHTFVENEADDPGTHHFGGLQNPGLVDAVAAWGPDAVLVFGWNYRSHLRALRAFHGDVPVLFRGDSTLIDEGTGPKDRARTLLRRLFLRWVYRHVDVALYVGRHNRDYFRAHGLGEDQLVWAPHTIDNARFAEPDGGALAREAATWRGDLGLGPDDRAVLFAGKLEPKKAPDILLEAYQQAFPLGAEGPAVHLLIVGTGPLEAGLRQSAAGDPRVHFLGFQNQSRMPVAYRLGDVLALPSRGPGETWGLAVNEAMACGRPAVVTDRVGCAPDLVREGETGAVVPAGDVGALAAALRRVLVEDDPARMGEAASRLIAGWSIPEQAQRTEAAVVRAVSG